MYYWIAPWESRAAGRADAKACRIIETYAWIMSSEGLQLWRESLNTGSTKTFLPR
jgi:hypothetical protein